MAKTTRKSLLSTAPTYRTRPEKPTRVRAIRHPGNQPDCLLRSLRLVTTAKLQRHECLGKPARLGLLDRFEHAAFSVAISDRFVNGAADFVPFYRSKLRFGGTRAIVMPRQRRQSVATKRSSAGRVEASPQRPDVRASLIQTPALWHRLKPQLAVGCGPRGGR